MPEPVEERALHTKINFETAYKLRIKSYVQIQEESKKIWETIIYQIKMKLDDRIQLLVANFLTILEQFIQKFLLMICKNTIGIANCTTYLFFMLCQSRCED